MTVASDVIFDRTFTKYSGIYLLDFVVYIGAFHCVINGFLVFILSIAYMGVLFTIAYAGDQKPTLYTGQGIGLPFTN